MKQGLRIGVLALILAGLVLLLTALGRGADRTRAQRTCHRLKIAVLDSTRLGFVTQQDVKDIIDREYGVYVGKALDSINLKRIENLLEGRSAIRTCEAYTTGDGILHVAVTQREPVIRFKTAGGGFYADATGFLFPLHPGYDCNVTVIEGEIPLQVPAGFKGVPSTEKERSWLCDITGFAQRLDADRKWKGAFSRIAVGTDGDLVLYPSKGKEKFLFGGPDGYADKLARMEKYYTHIAPAKEPGYYKTVNVKYEQQIICRTQ